MYLDLEFQTEVVLTVLSVLNKHIKSSIVCEFGCKVLHRTKILFNTVRDLPLFVNLDVIETAIKVVGVHIDNFGMCSSCCSLIASILGLESIILKRDIVAAFVSRVGLVEVVLNIMRTHLSDEDVCCNSCKILNKTMLLIRKNNNNNEAQHIIHHLGHLFIFSFFFH